MTTAEEILCTNCGLCCDGSLFADVELSSEREALRLEILGLQIDDTDHPTLLQPCAALKSKRCAIYKFRPNCCRTFECGLLKKVKSGTISIRSAQLKITKILHQLKSKKPAPSKKLFYTELSKPL